MESAEPPSVLSINRAHIPGPVLDCTRCIRTSSIWSTVWASATITGPAPSPRGLRPSAASWTAAASGDCERAAVLLGASDQVWQTVGVPLFGAKHLLARREQFEDVARQAMGNSGFDTAFARGGQLTVEDMLTFALRERRVSPVEPRQADSLLTPREREVGDLVAQGMSSRDVAAKLVISRRTVDVHVEHIFAKLGFNSRTQIATWVAHQGSTPPDGG